MAKRRNRERAYWARDAKVAVDQRVAVAKLFGCCRVVFNDACAARRKAHREGEKFPSGTDLQKQLITEAKDTIDRAWLSEVSAVPLQQSVQDNGVAYRNFFDSVTGKRKGRSVGLPRFKRKSHRQSARFTRNARFKFTKMNRTTYWLRLPGIPGQLRVKCSREIPVDPSSVTLVQEPDGRLYVSICHEVSQESLDAQVKPPLDTAVGVDVELESYTAETHLDPENQKAIRSKEANPRLLRRNAKQLAKAQRRLARKQKGSNNYRKQRIKVAASHRKVKESRLYLQRQVARRLAHQNQVIALETLNVKGMCRSGPKGLKGRGLRKSVHDASWGQFVAQVQYYADLWGREVIRISQWEPTSQVCAVCGVKDGTKNLSIREWECQSCGASLDRDWNASVNILLAAGQVDRLNDCGVDVRLRMAEATNAEAVTIPMPQGTGNLQAAA